MKDLEFIELVEYAIEQLEVQGEASRGDTGGCYYQNEEGLCCIVGHMMPDKGTRELADSFTNTTIANLAEEGLPWALQFNSKQIKVLSGLQRLHDKIGVSIHNGFSNSIDKMRRVIGNY